MPHHRIKFIIIYVFLFFNPFSFACAPSDEQYECNFIADCYEGNIENFQSHTEHKGFDINQLHRGRNKKGLMLSALHVAVLKNDIKLVEKIINIPGVYLNKATIKECETAFYIAASHGYLAILQLLADTKKVHVNQKNWKNKSPFEIAAKHGHLKTIQYLSSNETAIGLQITHSMKKRALMEAAYSNYPKMLIFLLANFPSIDINSRDPDGNTALHYAAQEGHIEIVKEFLKHDNIKIYIINKDLAVPLSFAVRYGHADIVKCLLHHTVIKKYTIPEKIMEDLIESAVKYGYADIAKNLYDFLATHNTAAPLKKKFFQEVIEMAFSEGHLDKMKWLIDETDTNINLVNLLVAAVLFNKISIVKWLHKEKGVNLNETAPYICIHRKHKKYTALYAAVALNNEEAVKCLLELGAEVNKKGNNNKLPLMKAIQNCDITTVKLLIEAGAVYKINKVQKLIKKHIKHATLKYYLIYQDIEKLLIENLKQQANFDTKVDEQQSTSEQPSTSAIELRCN